jgi:glycosyltransferase involved in cell wall biosynthesis
MASLLRERGVPATQIHLCPNWAPEGLQPALPESASTLRTRWGFDGKLVVAYSGNLGRVHDFTAIIPLAESLRAEADIAFVFIGDGAQRPALEAAAHERGLANIHFHPAQPREQLTETLALGDIHLVTLRTGCERLVFPSKLYGIAAIGRPVLFIGPRDCEVARVIETNRFGHAFTSDASDIARLVETLRSLKSDPAQRLSLGHAASAFCEREGRLQHATTRWFQLVTGKPLADTSSSASL